MEVPATRKLPLTLGICALIVLSSCKPKTVQEAEQKRDVAWLIDNGSPESVAALGRLADNDLAAVTALTKRSDVNAYIAAWAAMTRNAPWGATLLKAALADPTQAEIATSVLPRRDPRVGPLVPDLESAVVRLSASKRGGIVAGVLASLGPVGHAAVQRRLEDPKTRGSMCDGIGLPEASGDAKSLVLAVPAEARDHESCVGVVVEMAKTENVVVGWLGSSAEPGLLSAVAKGTLACPRVALIWEKALTDRPPETHAALNVPLHLSMKRCASALDPTLAELLAKAPRSRACIIQALDPFGSETADLKQTCAGLRKGWHHGESARVRARAEEALSRGCTFAK